MQLKVHFYLEDKIKFLTKLGYEVRRVIIEMGYPCYHNDMKYEEKKVWGVFRNGSEYLNPGGYNFREEQWLDDVFEDEVSRKMAKLILSD